MDWPAFALITYAFLLALLLALIILRSLRSTKRHYQQSLEEKEQKLAAMQLDLEETLEALQAQAELLEAEWGDAKRISQEALLAMQNRFLEMQGALAGLQGRFSRLEQGLREGGPAAQPIVLAGQAQMPEVAAQPLAEEGWPESAATQSAAEMAPGRQALALLQGGMSVADVSRTLGCSWTEATLLYNQWRRGFLDGDAGEGPAQ